MTLQKFYIIGCLCGPCVVELAEDRQDLCCRSWLIFTLRTFSYITHIERSLLNYCVVRLCIQGSVYHEKLNAEVNLILSELH